MKIFFDMDGTIADLYGVENWLYYLRNFNPYPYAEAKPLVRLCSLAKILNRLQREGHEICIISWLSKTSTVEYDELVIDTKKMWLKKHLKSVQFDEIHIVSYGMPKEKFCCGEDDILFDDEEKNRQSWTGRAFDVNNILEVLKTL